MQKITSIQAFENNIQGGQPKNHRRLVVDIAADGATKAPSETRETCLSMFASSRPWIDGSGLPSLNIFPVHAAAVSRPSGQPNSTRMNQ